MEAYRMAQLIVKAGFPYPGLLPEVLDAARSGLDQYAMTASMKLPADYRLAFRELGLSIGMHAVKQMKGLINQYAGAFDKASSLSSQADRLLRHSPLQREIENFWLKRHNRVSAAWSAHLFINTVMLATSLLPDGFLSIA